eukprot:6189249-Pleurochrysis_carterae.AAC.4
MERPSQRNKAAREDENCCVAVCGARFSRPQFVGQDERAGGDVPVRRDIGRPARVRRLRPCVRRRARAAEHAVPRRILRAACAGARERARPVA